MSLPRRIGMLAFVAGLGGCLAGCPARSVVPEAADLSAALAFVNEHFEEFVWPAQSVMPGADPVASAATLAGCWGRTVHAHAEGAPAGAPALDAAEVYQFGPADGVVQYAFYTRTAEPPAEAALFANGTFFVTEAGLLHIVLDDWWAYDPVSGETAPLSDAQPLGLFLRADLCGEWLVLTEDLYKAPNGAPKSLVYRHFDCGAKPPVEE